MLLSLILALAAFRVLPPDRYFAFASGVILPARDFIVASSCRYRLHQSQSQLTVQPRQL